MRFLIRGVTYESVYEVSRALNVATGSVYSAVSRETLDTLGLGHHGANSKKGGRKTPLTVAGRTFPTHAACARFIGKEPHYVQQAIRGKAVAQQRLISRVREQIEREEGQKRKERQRNDK